MEEPLKIDWNNRRVWIYGRKLHHLDAGIILCLMGWLLIIHDWYWHERRKCDEDAQRQTP
ncbi:MAG: hypothetical protein ACE5GD_10295 [Candidatus Geothermarchaeales archaeon]